jgi:hypothetical protein
MQTPFFTAELKKPDTYSVARYTALREEIFNKITSDRNNTEDLILVLDIYHLARLPIPESSATESENKSNDKFKVEIAEFYLWVQYEIAKNSNVEQTLFLQYLCEGINRISKNGVPQDNSSPNSATAFISDEVMKKAVAEFSWEEHPFAHILGNLLVYLYAVGSGIIAVVAFVHIFSSFLVAPLVVALGLVMFIASFYLAYQTAKAIPEWFATANSWWKSFSDLSLSNKTLLIIGFLTTLAAGVTYGAITFSTTVTFLTALFLTFGISATICPPIAILLFLGMTIAATILLTKACCDLIKDHDIYKYFAALFAQNSVWKNVYNFILSIANNIGDYFKNIFAGKPLWKQILLAFVLLISYLALPLAIFGMLATMGEGLNSVKELLLEIPGAIPAIVDTASIWIAEILAFIGQVPFVFDTISRLFNQILHGENNSTDDKEVWAQVLHWFFVVIASIGDAALALWGIEGEPILKKALIALGQLFASIASAVISESDKHEQKESEKSVISPVGASP